MTRRFFLVATETDDEMTVGDVKMAFRYSKFPGGLTVIPADKTTAAIVALQAGVPVHEVCGMPEDVPEVTVPGVNRRP